MTRHYLKAHGLFKKSLVFSSRGSQELGIFQWLCSFLLTELGRQCLSGFHEIYICILGVGREWRVVLALDSTRHIFPLGYSPGVLMGEENKSSTLLVSWHGEFFFHLTLRVPTGNRNTSSWIFKGGFNKGLFAKMWAECRESIGLGQCLGENKSGGLYSNWVRVVKEESGFWNAKQEGAV